MRGERGFALLLVLWSLVLLTLITTRLVGAGRSEARLAINLRAAASAEMVADAAVHEAMFRLLDQPSTGWAADGTRRHLTLPGGTVEVVIEDHSGLVNPNRASDLLLQALLRGVGADSGTARSAAAAIQDWRSRGASARQFGAKAAEYRAAGRDYGPPEAPFRTTGEVGLVLGMTPALLRQLTPHLTVSFDGDPDPTAAGPVVLQALQASVGQSNLGGGAKGDQVITITTLAESQGGGRFVRQAVVRVGSSGPERVHQVLEWRRGAG